MKCPKCHFDNPETQRFCGECGTQLIRGHVPNSHEFGTCPQNSVTETLETAPEELATVTTFGGRYEIIEELGKGGMGKVYRVFDKKIEVEAALKLVKPETRKRLASLQKSS